MIPCPFSRTVKVPYYGINDGSPNIRFEDGNFYRLISVDCGHCHVCRQRQRSEWQFRLQQEYKQYRPSQCFFVTLTYAPEHLPAGGNLCYKDVQSYHHRLRKSLVRKYGKFCRFRFFAVGEYGYNGTNRPHYHIIYFVTNCAPASFVSCVRSEWRNGIVDFKRVTQGRISYVSGYSGFSDGGCHSVRPFSRQSNRPAIGSSYLSRQCVGYHRANDSHVVYLKGCPKGGSKSTDVPKSYIIRLPRFYEKKIFGETKCLPQIEIAKRFRQSDESFLRKKLTYQSDPASRSAFRFAFEAHGHSEALSFFSDFVCPRHVYREYFGLPLLPRPYVDQCRRKFEYLVRSHERRDSRQHINISFLTWLQSSHKFLRNSRKGRISPFGTTISGLPSLDVSRPIYASILSPEIPSEIALPF